jgi:hypothetical protein
LDRGCNKESDNYNRPNPTWQRPQDLWAWKPTKIICIQLVLYLWSSFKVSSVNVAVLCFKNVKILDITFELRKICRQAVDPVFNGSCASNLVQNRFIEEKVCSSEGLQRVKTLIFHHIDKLRTTVCLICFDWVTSSKICYSISTRPVCSDVCILPYQPIRVHLWV